MNTEILTDLLNTYPFLRHVGCCEYQLCKTCCDETQLHKAIDTFPRFQAIGIESEVLFGVSKGGFLFATFVDNTRRSAGFSSVKSVVKTQKYR